MNIAYFAQADIVIAIIFFTSAFNYLFGLIILVTMVVYLGEKLGTFSTNMSKALLLIMLI